MFIIARSSKLKKLYWTVSLIILMGIGTLFARTYYFKNNFELISPKRGNIVEAIYGLGKVKSDQIFEVKIGVIAVINKTFVKEGAKVEKGDRLISFDDNALFKAPFDGTVTLLANQENEVAFPQVPILRLENLNKKYIEVSLEQDAALKIKPGQKAQVIFESQSFKKYSASVKMIYPREGEFIARLEVENLIDNILPGMTADTVIEVGSKTDVLLIPISSISNGKVLRLRDNHREKVDVALGNNDGNWAEVVSGDIKTTDKLFIKR